jgi:hypothetical protein
VTRSRFEPYRFRVCHRYYWTLLLRTCHFVCLVSSQGKSTHTAERSGAGRGGQQLVIQFVETVPRIKSHAAGRSALLRCMSVFTLRPMHCHPAFRALLVGCPWLMLRPLQPVVQLNLSTIRTVFCSSHWTAIIYNIITWHTFWWQKSKHRSLIFGGF